jgi:hypothetical protein
MRAAVVLLRANSYVEHNKSITARHLGQLGTGRSELDQPTKAYLKVIASDPEAVAAALWTKGAA